MTFRARVWVLGSALVVAGGSLLLARRAPPRPTLVAPAVHAEADAASAVLVSGCGAMLRGGVCEIAEGDAVRLWIRAEAARLSFDADGATLASVNAGAVDGGTLVTLAPSVGARQVHVRRDGARFFTLPLTAAPPLPKSVVDARALRDDDKLEEAARRLEGDRARAEREGDAPALLALLARVTRSRQREEEADALFASSIEANERAGRLSDAANDCFALAYSLADRSRFVESRRVLDRADDFSRGSSDCEAREAYYRGYLAAATGDSRAALREDRAAAERARRTGMRRLQWMAREQIAKELDKVGRTSEAREDLEEMRTSAGASMAPCDAADLEGTIGWLALHQREPSRIDARPWLERSLVLERTKCVGSPNPARIADTLGDLAEAELEAGRTREARARLKEATAALAHPLPELGFEWLATRGHIALAEKNADEARRTFDELAAKAEALGARGWQVVALEGAAEARMLRGDREGALTQLARVDDVVDLASTAIPLGEGRETFMEAHAQADVNRVELLVSLGRAGEALRAMRESRARLLAGLESADRLASLDAAGRMQWDDAVGAYRRERDAIDGEAADDWNFAKETLASRRSARAARAAAAQAALDDALAKVVSKGGVSDRRRTFETPDALVLAYFPTNHGWLGFAAEPQAPGALDAKDHVRVADLGAVDVTASAEVLAARMLAPFHDEIDRARRLAVVATGDARSVDVHALPWEGAPLVARLAVVYPVDRRSAIDDAAVASHRALVVGDPTSDLRGARAEMDLVTRALTEASWQVSVLRGDAATGGAVRSALATSDLFQYAGHGRFGGRDGSSSALPLAEHGELAVTDILALPRAPRSVVLLGCETARDSSDVRVEGLGLAHAFVIAGSRGVVAATREVSDTATSELAAALYAHGAVDVDLGESLRAAQHDAWQRGVADWSAFRVLVP